MKNFTLIAGASGVGKTSLLGVLRAERTDIGIVFDDEKDVLEKKIRGIIKDGRDFSLETTLYGDASKRICQQAKEAGYNIRMYYIGLDTLDEILLRIQKRVEHGERSVPTENVEAQFTHRSDDIPEILPYCDEAKFFDNYNGFVLVAEYRNDRLLPVGLYQPQWLSQLLERLQRN